MIAKTLPNLNNSSLSAAVVSVLRCSNPYHKAELVQKLPELWHKGRITTLGDISPPDQPARPPTPKLLAPRDMPKRGTAGSVAGRIALLHAIAHIELNAIDLACDIIARFATKTLPRKYFDDWIKVASEEGLHFLLLANRLEKMGTSYGALPAHNGLWEAAQETAHDLLARLAIVPLVLEARGLDVTPIMIKNFNKIGDSSSVQILKRIYQDEIGHVAIGQQWFLHLCNEQKVDPRETWRDLVKKHFKGKLKPPFNVEARQLAGMPQNYYLMNF